METKGGGLAKYRAFILNFCEKATVLVANNTINQHIRVVSFLTAFSNQLGDDSYKKYNIDLANLATITNVFANLKREALIIYVNEDSQMKRFRKQMTLEDVEESKDTLKEKIREREKAKEREARKKTEGK